MRNPVATLRNWLAIGGRVELTAVEARRTAKILAELRAENALLRTSIGSLNELAAALRAHVQALESELRDRLLQYNLQLGRLARAVGVNGSAEAEEPRLSGRSLPREQGALEPAPWNAVGGDVTHPDPEGREWRTLDACPICGHGERTVVCPWNKLLLLAKAPDATSARYDYAVCHACGVLSATRRPSGARYLFLLEHFGEVTAKRGGGRNIPNPVLNPYPLTDEQRGRLKELVARGVFVSDHSAIKSSDYLAGLLRDRFDASGHVDLIGSLLQPRGARVLEVRSRTGAILDGLRRYWGADVYAMPIWESQQLLVQEVYGIPASRVIDFEHFHIPFEERFDLIVCQHMLTHVLDPQEFFGELRRHLNPGGHIYLHNEPHDAEFLSGQQSMIATLNPLHMQAFDQPSLIRALAANGFETVFIKRREHNHVCLAQAADVAMTPMGPRERARRLDAYGRAFDRALLGLDDRARSRLPESWKAIIERAVVSGAAEYDAEGRLRIATETVADGDTA